MVGASIAYTLTGAVSSRQTYLHKKSGVKEGRGLIFEEGIFSVEFGNIVNWLRIINLIICTS